MSQRSNTIKAVGLYTYLSELQAPEGSQKTADNVNIDEMGVITPRRGFNDYGQELDEADQRVKQILNYKGRILRHYNGFLSYDDGIGNFTNFLGTINEVEDGFRIKSEEVNGNLYFTSSDGIKKLSASSSSDFPNINPVDSGVPKAVDISAKIVPSDTGFLPPKSKVGYKILYGYRDNNNVLLLGSPTSVVTVTNSSIQTNIPEQFEIEIVSTAIGADFVDVDEVSKYFLISTLNLDYFIWYNLTDAAEGSETKKPEDSVTFGKTGIQVNIETLDTATTIAAKTANTILNELGNYYDISLSSRKITLVSKEDGDVKNPDEAELSVQLNITIVQEGSVEKGSSSNCEISTTIPQGVDSNFFIQVYRTQVITATEDQELSDISPGEECNLVYEQALINLETNEPLSAGDTFTYLDNITNSFRDSGTPLYNNPFSGEGLLQNNEVPPIAKDIQNFNNYTFYGNTKTFHRSQFRFVSVNDFGNEQTSIFIGNQDDLRQYVFRGTQEVTTIECGTINDTKENVIESNVLYVSDYNGTIESIDSNPAHIKIYTRENENKYYLWYNKGTSVDPINASGLPLSELDGFIGIRVDILEGDTKKDIANKTLSKLNQLNGLNLNIINTIDVTVDAENDTFNAVDHNLLNGEKIIYNENEYYTINQQEDAFQISDVNPGIEVSFIEYESNILSVEVDPINNTILRKSHGIINDSQIIYNEVSYFVINSNTNSFQISETLGGVAVPIITNAYEQTVNGSVSYFANNGIDFTGSGAPLTSNVFIENGTNNIYIGIRNAIFGFNQKELIVKSTDGYNFTVIVSTTGTIPQGNVEVIHKNSNGRIILYHESKQVYYSDNEGVDFTAINVSGFSLDSITSISSNGNIVVCGLEKSTSDNNNILYSSNGGTSFSQIDTGFDANFKVEWIDSDNLFIAYGTSTATGTGIILTSPDGTNWTQQHSVPNENLIDFNSSENKYVIISNKSTIESIDLLTWSDNINVAPFVDTVTQVDFINLEVIDNVYIAHTTENKMATSLDLINWNFTSEVTFNDNIPVIYDQSRNRLFSRNFLEAIIEAPIFNLPIQGSTLSVQENATSDQLELINHGLVDDDYILYNGNEYYVINSSANSFQLSETSGGSVLNIETNDTVDIIKSEEYSDTLEIVDPYRVSITNQKAGFSGENGSNGVDLYQQQNMENVNKETGHSSYITLYSAEDEFKYYIWFDKGNSIDPLVDSAISVKVNLSNELLTGTENVSGYLNNALLNIIDFDLEYSQFENKTVIITNVENGDSTNASSPSGDIVNDIGNGWSISVSNGTGEDATQNYCKWSIDPSLAISLEKTARSFVKVINKDPLSPVNAFYLSGDADTPGLVLLENRDLEDKPFYVGVNNISSFATSISDEFDPSIPFVQTGDSFSEGSSNINKLIGENVIRVTFDNHGLNAGDKIYFYLANNTNPNGTPQLTQTFTVLNKTETGIDPLNNFYLEYDQILETNNNPVLYFYKTDLESDNEEKANRVYYSKLLQPEAVPLGNYFDVGSKDEPIERILALRDTLFILKTDGIYTVTGFSAPFNVRLLDGTSSIIAPDSAVVSNNLIYALTDNGISVVSESGSSIISRPIENRILDVTTENFNYRLSTFGVSYENDNSYILWLPSSSEDQVATQAYRYNYFEKTWTRWTVPATCGLVSKNNVLYIGNGDRPYMQKERKNRNRIDFSDRNFTRQIPESSINGNIIALTSYTEVEIGDVLVQDQYVTIDVFNNLLLKLDIDPAVSDNNEEELRIQTGQNISTKLEDLNSKLVAEGTISTSYTWNNFDIESLRDNYNLLIQELNSETSGTQFKTYNEVSELISYESIIIDKNTIRPDLNQIEVLIEPRFVEGDVEVYKAIQCEVQWNPLHFGDPSAQKQFSKGTIIVDQNNFTKATVSYSSDVSPEFIQIEKNGKGVGYYSSGNYGNLDLYWGGSGSDVPLMNIIPREKQRGRYLNVKFQHAVAREGIRLVGLSTIIRAISGRAFR